MELHHLSPAPGSTSVAKRKGRGAGTGNGTACHGSIQRLLFRQCNTVQGRLGNAKDADQAGRNSGRTLLTGLLLECPCQNSTGNSQIGVEEVGQHIVMTQNFQILQLYGRPALDAKDNGKRNDAAYQRTCKRTSVSEQPCKTTGHALGDPVAQRSGKTQEQRCRNQERQRAGKDDAQIFGHMLVDEMENDGEDPHRQG